MRLVSRILPPSYVFEDLRAIISGHAVSMASFACGAALAVAYLFLAYWFFARVYRHVLRSGLIARYSAETLS
jgi:ABC-2 type transport system permease protein